MDDAPEGEGPAYVSGAMMAGLTMGLLSVFECCCLFTIPASGALAARVAARPAEWFGWQEGAVAGAAGGGIAWLVQSCIKVPLSMMMPKVYASNPLLLDGIPPALREAFMRTPSPAELAGMMAFTLVLMVGGATLTGAIAGHTGLRKEPTA
jgi:hypothetical protein